MKSIDSTPKFILDQRYVAYSYSYPHKSSYGELSPAVQLDELWQSEDRRSLFLYVHLPFCEMRCGFCNLFATAGGEESAIDSYLDSIERQARRMAEVTQGDRNVTRLALGGGTPTVLSAAQLDRLFRLLSHQFDFDPTAVPVSVETSPKTATAKKLELLRHWGVQRVSIGVQSFIEAEAHSIGRPQKNDEVCDALSRIQALKFPILNIDLIYGQPNQSLATWRKSLENALQYSPREIFLYPLYVRPQTGLARREASLRESDARMIDLYQFGRDFLLKAGFRQHSMRCFSIDSQSVDTSPAYCCQSDGMLGLGAGARSYTSRLHYSSRFAVQAAGVRAILENWIQRTEEDFAVADWGIWLEEKERQRRFIIQSILHASGLNRNRFVETFCVSPEESVPELSDLCAANLVEEADGVLRLTPEGLAWSDAIGPMLYSEPSREKLAEFSLT